MTAGQLAVLTHAGGQLALALLALGAARSPAHPLSRLWAAAWLAGCAATLVPLAPFLPTAIAVGLVTAMVAHAFLLVGAASTFHGSSIHVPWIGGGVAVMLCAAPLALVPQALMEAATALILALGAGLAALALEPPRGVAGSGVRLAQAALLVRAAHASAGFLSPPPPLVEIIPQTELVAEILVMGGLLVATLEGSTRALLATRAELQEARRSLDVSAITDPLTSFLDRRVFRRLVDRVRGGEAPRTGSLLVFDMDGLKRINDTRGHSAGDSAIRRLALTIAGRLNPGDMAIRWGGDEFLIVLPERASREAQRLRDGILAAARRQHLYASTGLAIYDAQHDIVDAFREADRRMYGAKRHRRVTRRVHPAQLTLPLGATATRA